MSLNRFLLIVFLILIQKSAFAQTQPEIFDVNVYEGIYPDLFNAYGSNTTAARNHWLIQGLPVEGRRASLIFDVSYYTTHNQGVPTGYVAALQDFMYNGLPAGKRGSLEFDVKFYLAKYPDLAAAFGTNYVAAADHFLNQGLPCEGRQGSPDFAVADYINMYLDVAAGYPRILPCATGNTDYKQAIMHWLRRGKQLGRHGFGFLNAATECGRGQNIVEFGSVPAASPFTIAVSQAAAFTLDVSVSYINAPQTQLTPSGSNPPGPGQYSVAAGVYTFNPADKEQPVKITYNLTPVPAGYQRIFFTIRTNGVPGDGSIDNPFDGSVLNDALQNIQLDTILRHISEQTPGQVPLNHDTGQPYGPYNLIVCLDDSGIFQTRGNWDWVVHQFHKRGDPENPANQNPGGFTVNRNWHIHGKGLWSTIVQLYDYLLDPTSEGFPPNLQFPNTHTGMGIVFGTFDDTVGNVEISDLAIDGNFSALRAKAPAYLNLLPVVLRSDVGGHNLHNLNIYSFAGEVGGVDIHWEGFPIAIISASGLNKTPSQSANNQIKYVLASNPAPMGACTSITVANVQAEVAYNVVNGWNATYGVFGACQAMGGWDLSNAWFHDNIVFNSYNGFLTDSGTNRGVVIEFNQFINPTHYGIVVGAGHKFDYYTIQWNTINMSMDHNIGILLQGNVYGATVTRNNILLSGSPPNTTGIVSATTHGPNLGGVFQYNQIGTGSSRLDGNCVGLNWNQFGNPIATPAPNSGGGPCPPPAPALATLQMDSNFVVYGAGNALWASYTSGLNAPNLTLLDNGKLTLYQSVWQAGTPVPPPGVQIPYDICRIGATLSAGQTLAQNQCLESASGQYFLFMQSDGDLVLYDRVAGQVTWESNTYNNPNAYAVMQTDGNFVVYAANGVALWSSITYGTVANHLDIQDDGQIVLYGPVWSSTNQAGPTTPTLPHPQPAECTDAGPGMSWGGVLGATSCFVSPNGRYKLYMQPDGGLVLYDRSVTPNLPLWANNNN